MNRPGVILLVLCVAVALGFVVVQAFAMYRLYRTHAHEGDNTKMRIHFVEQALVHYQTDNAKACPPSIEALVDGHYLTRLPRDEWGQPLAFTCPELHNRDGADAVSAGEDRRLGTVDDIKSWDL
jgi:hypothetical protein